MSQGMFTSISGIKNFQSQIDVISDNIANLNSTGFKASKVTFANIFSQTYSIGSAPQSTVGGSNPMQIGLGAAISDISRNFTAGPVQTTGRSTDFNIQGNGFFTLLDAEEKTVLSRAGNFSLDSDGNLVNASGLKVVGTSTVFSNSGSSSTVRIPPALKLEVEGNDAFATKSLSDLNASTITDGDFNIKVNTTSNTSVDVPVTVSSTDTVNSLIAKINAAFTTNNINATADVTTDGKITIATQDTASGTLHGVSSVEWENGTSNFLSDSKLATATGTTSSGTTTYTSKTLDYKATIGVADNIQNGEVMSSWAIAKDGAVEATYSNGDTLTVETNGNARELLYKTSDGINISFSNITVTGSAIDAANLQLQMSNVVNPKGLISNGGTTFSIGPNTGTQTFSIARNNGMGSIDSGGLESSNVDLPTEFANMLIAQNAINANSRAFQVLNQIMSTIVYLGR